MEMTYETAEGQRPGWLEEADREWPRRTDKPWGCELLWAFGERYAAKMLHIETGRRLSLQYHRVKDETLFVLCGRLVLELEDSDGRMARHVGTAGQVFHVPAGRKHRLSAEAACLVVEASTPELDDLVRLQDDFGRVPSAERLDAEPRAQSETSHQLTIVIPCYQEARHILGTLRALRESAGERADLEILVVDG